MPGCFEQYGYILQRQDMERHAYTHPSHMHTDMHTHIHTLTFTETYTIYTNPHTHLHNHTHAHIYIHNYTHMYTHKNHTLTDCCNTLHTVSLQVRPDSWSAHTSV